MFGASLMSDAPHDERVRTDDIRRHGGGLGVWLSVWTWCWIGSLSIGFACGSILVNYRTPVWGFYLSIALLSTILLLNIFCPDVKNSL
jgi:hypothetical protein